MALSRTKLRARLVAAVFTVAVLGFRDHDGAVGRRQQVVDRLRRWSGEQPVFSFCLDQQVERRQPHGRLDLSLRRDGFNPIVVAGTIYGRGRNGAIIALDAKTGKEIWIHEGMQAMSARGHELLGEQGREGSPSRLRHERLSAGD